MKKTNGLNVGTILRTEINKQGNGIRIQKDAVQELRLRIKDRVEDIAIGLCEQMRKEHRKVIKEDDIVLYLGMFGRDVI